MGCISCSNMSEHARHRVGEDINEFYDVKKELGKGAFSVVKLATCKEGGKDYELKIMKRGAKDDQNKQKIIDTEINILRQVSHPHVVKLKEIFEDDEDIILVLQLITGGELFERIVEKNFYTEEDARKVVRQILTGLEALHAKNVVHRDLKPENLLLSDKSDEADVLITDFGLSAILPVDGSGVADAVGTPSYIAPEILIALDTGTGYGTEVDVWGVGVITYILLCGFVPFYGEDEDEVYDRIEDGDYSFPSPYWDKISSEAKDFVSGCFHLDRNQRLTIQGALNHPWMLTAVPEVSLNECLEEMAKFNARRKFKSAVKGLIAVQKFSSGFKFPVPGSKKEEGGDKPVKTKRGIRTEASGILVKIN